MSHMVPTSVPQTEYRLTVSLGGKFPVTQSTKFVDGLSCWPGVGKPGRGFTAAAARAIGAAANAKLVVAASTFAAELSGLTKPKMFSNSRRANARSVQISGG